MENEIEKQRKLWTDDPLKDVDTQKYVYRVRVCYGCDEMNELIFYNFPGD